MRIRVQNVCFSLHCAPSFLNIFSFLEHKKYQIASDPGFTWCSALLLT